MNQAHGSLSAPFLLHAVEDRLTKRRKGTNVANGQWGGDFLIISSCSTETPKEDARPISVDSMTGLQLKQTQEIIHRQ